MGIGLILLAAGNSTRLGRPKQLLDYRGRSLLRRAALEALATDCRPVIAVLGASADESKIELHDLPVQIVLNERWVEGMGSSIRTGLAALEAAGEATEAVIVMLCDQPLIDARMIERLIAAHDPRRNLIVAAAYGGTRGVPALFGRALFPALRDLRGHEGARKIIARDDLQDKVAEVQLPEAATDIDTALDYQTLLARENAGEETTTKETRRVD